MTVSAGGSSVTVQQILSILIISGLMAGFVWGRLRYDLVAALSLAMAVAVGLVAPAEAFKGFSDDIVIIVASALVLSAAIASSGLLDTGLRFLTGRVSSVQGLVIALVVFVTALSAIVKNIGTLAMTLPVAIQIAKKKNVSPSLFLMPMAFGSLLGGMITLVGTSPNVIVARVRQELTGQPFAMFDFAPVGITLSLVGVAFLAIGFRLIPSNRKGISGIEAALDIKDYTTEAIVEPDSAACEMTVSELLMQTSDDIKISSLIRSDQSERMPLPDAKIKAGDTLILRGSEPALERFLSSQGLRQESEHRMTRVQESREAMLAVEGVIGAYSGLIGSSAGDATLHREYGVNLVAISRAGARMTQRLRNIVLREGDVVVLRGPEEEMPERLRQLGILPLAERAITLGGQRRGAVALAILTITIITVAMGLVPVAIGLPAPRSPWCFSVRSP